VNRLGADAHRRRIGGAPAATTSGIATDGPRLSIANFELFRRNLHAPEIVTFDEMFYRAELLVENLDQSMSSEDRGSDEDEVPF